MSLNFSAIEFTQDLLKKAVAERASDIHLEPQMTNVRLRLRIDGLLHEMNFLSKVEGSLVINHLKILAQMDIAESRLAQDGNFSFYLEENCYKECRVASCPSIYGEKLVLRLLENSYDLNKCSELGFSEQALATFQQSLGEPQGLILVTGPTGSGKTLTLYHALTLLNQPSRNIISIEDPVEIKMPGITQVNINRKIGFDFARALRSFLRQDPDVIMLGEIRDAETAEMVIKAAQTGHLVLATLHTNDAASSITRLTNLGVEAYNIADTLKLVIAQRLVRKICVHCQGKSCNACKMGYYGRTGIYEVLKITPELSTAIANKASIKELLTLAQHQGFENLAQAAQTKLNQGFTHWQEIQRVLPG